MLALCLVCFLSGWLSAWLDLGLGWVGLGWDWLQAWLALGRIGIGPDWLRAWLGLGLMDIFSGLAFAES